jgi:hypothetical protein
LDSYHAPFAEEAVRLSGEAVSLVVRERAAAAGLDPMRYSGHAAAKKY